MLIIGHQHTAAAIRLPEQRQQAFHVLRRSALAHHDILPAPEFFHRLVDIGAFMVRLHPCRDIGIQLPAAEQGCVPIDLFTGSIAIADLLQDLFIGAHGAVGVHQFCQPQHPGLLVIGAQVLGFQHSAGFVQTRGRHTGRQHKIDRERQILCGFQHKFQPCGTGHIGDLVRVGDDRRGPVGQHRLLKGGAAEHGAFNVDMPIHKTRADVSALQVQLGLAAIAAYAQDLSLPDGYICLLDLVCEYVEHLCVFQHKLSALITLCGQDLLL